MNVVMLDDERISLAVLENQIGKIDDVSGFAFTHPTEALRWCAANRADAVVLDFMMHEMDGLEFIERFRLIPGTADVPVLMISGLRDLGLERRARLLGVTDFFTKPVDMSALRLRLTALLGERSQGVTQQRMPV